jgi:hypothetical protein
MAPKQSKKERTRTGRQRLAGTGEKKEKQARRATKVKPKVTFLQAAKSNHLLFFFVP